MGPAAVLAAIASAVPADPDDPRPAAGARADAPPVCAAVAAAVASVDRARLEADVRALAACGTRHPLSPVDHPTRGVGAARRHLRDQLALAADSASGRARLREQPFERRLGRGSEAVGRFVNFILELPGHDETRGIWLIGGHYDSRNSDPHDGTRDAPGADDDASGTAVVLELARVLAAAAADEPLAAGVWLCAFDGEEHGLFGSDLLAEEMKQQGLAVEGMVTNDIVGAAEAPASRLRRLRDSPPDRPPPAGVLRCFSEPFAEGAEQEPWFRVVGGESDGPSRQLARFADRVAGRHLDGELDVRLVLRRDRFGRGGDHSSFTRRGFPGVRFTEPDEDYRHQHQDVRVEEGVQYGDLVEFVDFEQLARVARLNLALVMEGAGAPPPPARVHLEGAVQPHATVEWIAAGGGELASHRVFVRATAESTWSQSFFVPAPADRFKARGFSIDDWQFGVASVGQDGRESPVRFPEARPRPARAGAAGR